MGVEKLITESSSGVACLTGLALLGALYCVILGVFKKFQASMTFSGAGGVEAAPTEIRSEVYRPFQAEVYSQSYRVISEDAMISPPVSTLPKVGWPKAESSGTYSALSNKLQATKIATLPTNGVSKPQPAQPTTPNVASTSGAVISEKPAKKKPTKSKDGKASKGKLTDEERKRKLKARKAKEKAKQEKESTFSFPFFSKKTTEVIPKKVKEEKVKEKKVKGKEQTQQVASVTIDVEAVASTQAAMKNPIASGNTRPANPLASNLAKPDNLAGAMSDMSISQQNPQNTFTSSWDMVAEHRQNMQRDVRPEVPANNLRGMAMQHRAEAVDTGKLFTPSKNSPRNAAPLARTANRRMPSFSDTDSDTEA